MQELLRELQESLLSNSRSVQIAFHLYEILGKAGYDDDLIEEVAGALGDIVA